MKSREWSYYEKAAEHGPGSILFRVVVFFALAIAGISSLGYVFGWFGEAAAVAREEFGPREALRKYEWFKDAAAALDKKRADIAVYDRRLADLGAAYEGARRSEWTREDREQSSIWASESAGVRASYNALAADYNAQMAKFNWRFAEVGGLPSGAQQPLPREFKPYVSE